MRRQKRSRDARLGSSSAEPAGRGDDGGTKRHRGGDHHHHADEQRDAHRAEHRAAGEVQAEQRTGNGHAGPDDHMAGAVIHLVIGRLFVGALTSGLLIAAEQEDHIVGTGRDRHHHEQVDRERRQPDQVVITQEGHHATSRRQFEEHHEQRHQHGDDRAVDEQQHHGDDAERQAGDDLEASVAGDVGVVDQRRGSGDVGLDPGRRGHALDDLLDGFDRLVGQPLTHVAGQIGLHVGGSCRRRSASRPRSAGRSRNPGCARRASCRPRAS